MQVTNLQQQLIDARGENRELLSNMRDWGVSSSLPETSVVRDVHNNQEDVSGAQQGQLLLPEKLQMLERDLEAARVQAALSQAEVSELHAKMAKERDKVRSDQVVLAKEIKKLRAELSAAMKVSFESNNTPD